jgi:hypothetical protein
MNDDETLPTQFSHSVKIEQTVKGARITVHVNANEGLEAMEQSINLYRATRLELACGCIYFLTEPQRFYTCKYHIKERKRLEKQTRKVISSHTKR